jgi:hypothetical protein
MDEILLFSDICHELEVLGVYITFSNPSEPGFLSNTTLLYCSHPSPKSILPNLLGPASLTNSTCFLDLVTSFHIDDSGGVSGYEHSLKPSEEEDIHQDGGRGKEYNND